MPTSLHSRQWVAFSLTAMAKLATRAWHLTQRLYAYRAGAVVTETTFSFRQAKHRFCNETNGSVLHSCRHSERHRSSCAGRSLQTVHFRLNTSTMGGFIASSAFIFSAAKTSYLAFNFFVSRSVSSFSTSASRMGNQFPPLAKATALCAAASAPASVTGFPAMRFWRNCFDFLRAVSVLWIRPRRLTRLMYTSRASSKYFFLFSRRMRAIWGALRL